MQVGLGKANDHFPVKTHVPLYLPSFSLFQKCIWVSFIVAYFDFPNGLKKPDLLRQCQK